jgi:predicted ATPase
MKLKSLQISNVWSFKYFERIEDATTINFDDKFNIVIGQNGAGKSTTLEVINFIFRRVLFTPYIRDRDLYQQDSTINGGQRSSIIREAGGAKQYGNFRLEKNYDFESMPQFIRFTIQLDDIDFAILKLLRDSNPQVNEILSSYSTEPAIPDENFSNEYQIDVELQGADHTFKVLTNTDSGSLYFTKYHLFKEAIELFNEKNPNSKMVNLEEPFTLIGSYRNYQSFTPTVSLAGIGSADRQLENHRVGERSRSASQTEGGEPVVFGLVRIQMAKYCLELLPTNTSLLQAEQAANNLDFVVSINDIIKIVSLKLEITCTDYTSSNFSFSFIDTDRGRNITDINSLSAGQKAIVHLVFEAFGRGNINGGLVIIDEPELHLHYQFQNEYVRVIEKIMRQQKTQYILVTHSESLINSSTISSVIRFSLDATRYSQINQPIISTTDKWLVKILDLKRSNHAFFASKVLLVEGEMDAFFFNAALDHIENQLHKGLAQDIAVLSIDGKNNGEWRPFFHSFGLQTFSVFDLDYSFDLFYGGGRNKKLKTPSDIVAFRVSHPTVTAQIEGEYANNIFILKEGAIETYLGTKHDLSDVINFCEDQLGPFFSDASNPHVQEIKMILERVTGVSSALF